MFKVTQSNYSWAWINSKNIFQHYKFLSSIFLTQYWSQVDWWIFWDMNCDWQLPRPQDSIWAHNWNLVKIYFSLIMILILTKKQPQSSPFSEVYSLLLVHLLWEFLWIVISYNVFCCLTIFLPPLSHVINLHMSQQLNKLATWYKQNLWYKSNLKFNQFWILSSWPVHDIGPCDQ